MIKITLFSTLFSINLLFSQINNQEPQKSNFRFSGYLDTYYVTNFNKPTSHKNTGIAGTGRVFDQRANEFQIGLLQTKFSYTHEKAEVVGDLIFGPNADIVNYGNVTSPLGKTTSTALAIKQAYINFKPNPKLTLTAGQFSTHVGYEVIETPVNFHYSASNLFDNGPFYHIGVKATYLFSKKSSLMIGIINEVDNLFDNNYSKGFIAQYAFSPKDELHFYLNWIGSNESNPDVSGQDQVGYYCLFDCVINYQINSRFYMGSNFAYGTQSGDYQGTNSIDTEGKWGGMALYTHYLFSNHFTLGARYEYFDNSDGIRLVRNFNGKGTRVNSTTITGKFTFSDNHFFLKPEFRYDFYPKSTQANEQQFQDSNGNYTQNSQFTFGVAAIYQF